MTTQQLESFVKVAENLNFARAAESLNMTTSAVSRQIRSLEEELDTKLLHRTTKSVSLTPAGISFLNDTKEILGKLRLASQRLKNHSEANIQVLTIGCVNDAYLSLMTEFLRRCRECLPEIHPYFRVVPSRVILNQLFHNEIDAFFGFEDDIPMRDSFMYYELAQVPVCCALPSDHPLAQQEMLTEENLLSEKIVICNSYEVPPKIASIQNYLSHQSGPDSTYFTENLRAMLTLIQAGYGIGVLPDMPSGDTDIVYIPFGQGLSLSYGVFYKDPIQNPALKKFLAMLRSS